MTNLLVLAKLYVLVIAALFAGRLIWAIAGLQRTYRAADDAARGVASKPAALPATWQVSAAWLLIGSLASAGLVSAVAAWM